MYCSLNKGIKGKVEYSFEMKLFQAYEWMTGIVSVNKES